jgi:hypothetical protein
MGQLFPNLYGRTLLEQVRPPFGPAGLHDFREMEGGTSFRTLAMDRGSFPGPSAHTVEQDRYAAAIAMRRRDARCGIGRRFAVRSESRSCPARSFCRQRAWDKRGSMDWPASEGQSLVPLMQREHCQKRFRGSGSGARDCDSGRLWTSGRQRPRAALNR